MSFYSHDAGYLMGIMPSSSPESSGGYVPDASKLDCLSFHGSGIC